MRNAHDAMSVAMVPIGNPLSSVSDLIATLTHFATVVHFLTFFLVLCF